VHRQTSKRGQVIVAVALAILTLPITAYGIAVVPGTAVDPGLLVAASGFAVIGAAVIGSLLAHRPRRHSAWFAWVVAVFTSWPIAVTLLPIVPVALGRSFGIGLWCLDSCNPLIPATSVTSGVNAYVQGIFLGSTLATGYHVPNFWSLPIGLTVVAVAVAVLLVAGRRGHGALGLSVLVAAILTIVNSYSISQAPMPFAVLAAGAVAWCLLTAPGQKPIALAGPDWAIQPT
jgi:hypothetical protein